MSNEFGSQLLTFRFGFSREKNIDQLVDDTRFGLRGSIGNKLRKSVEFDRAIFDRVGMGMSLGTKCHAFQFGRRCRMQEQDRKKRRRFLGGAGQHHHCGLCRVTRVVIQHSREVRREIFAYPRNDYRIVIQHGVNNASAVKRKNGYRLTGGSRSDTPLFQVRAGQFLCSFECDDLFHCSSSTIRLQRQTPCRRRSRAILRAKADAP